MPRLPKALLPLLPWPAGPVAAQRIWTPPEFGQLPAVPGEIVDRTIVLPVVLGVLLVLALAIAVHHRMRRRRRQIRQEILGLANGPRFRVVDAMCHSLMRKGRIDPDRLARAHEIARGTTGMDFSREHLREVARRADRVLLPTDFRWMRAGLTREEKMVIFNAVAAVLLVDGPLDRTDRRFLRVLVRGLGVGRRELRRLGDMIDD